MPFDERKVDRKRKRGAAGSSSLGASASGASTDSSTLAQQARDVASRLEADVDALADTFMVWPPRKISDDAAVKSALQRLRDLPVVEKPSGASFRRWCQAFATRTASQLAEDERALARLFTDRVGEDIGRDCVGIRSSFARSLDGGQYTHVLVDRDRKQLAGSDVVAAHRDTANSQTLEESVGIVRKRDTGAHDEDCRSYVLGILLHDVTIADAPTIVALGTENVPDESSRYAYANAVKVPMTGQKDEIFVFEAHLLHAVLEPWSEPPRDAVSTRTRGGRNGSTTERWLKHIEEKFVVRTGRDKTPPSLEHDRNRTIILTTVSPRTLATNEKLIDQVVSRQARQLDFQRAPKRSE